MNNIILKNMRTQYMVLFYMFLSITALLLIYFLITNKFLWQCYAPCYGYIVGLLFFNKSELKSKKNVLIRYFLGTIMIITFLIHIFS